jgi:CRP-like cAMP-binding protein
MTSAAAFAPSPLQPLEDALDHLPRAAVATYRKGQMIYSEDRPGTGIYLVVDGSVKVCRMPRHEKQHLVDIYGPDEFFGESTLLGMPPYTETGTAFEIAKVMTWTLEKIQEISMDRPQLALALVRFIVQRSKGCCRHKDRTRTLVATIDFGFSH